MKLFNYILCIIFFEFNNLMILKYIYLFVRIKIRWFFKNTHPPIWKKYDRIKVEFDNFNMIFKKYTSRRTPIWKKYNQIKVEFDNFFKNHINRRRQVQI